MEFKGLTWDQVCRRASGRRHYNSVRQCIAKIRQGEVARLVVEEGFPIQRGAQARVARRLGVSEATISRDVQVILRYWREHYNDPDVRLRRVVREWEREDTGIDDGVGLPFLHGVPDKHRI